jgi:hypothetical protein
MSQVHTCANPCLQFQNEIEKHIPHIQITHVRANLHRPCQRGYGRQGKPRNPQPIVQTRRGAVVNHSNVTFPLPDFKNWVKLAMSPYSKYRRSRTFESLSTIRARCTGSASVLCGCIYVGGLPLYHNFKPSRFVFWYSSGHRQWNGRDPSNQSHQEDSDARVIQSFAASVSFRPLSLFAFASRICFQWAL